MNRFHLLPTAKLPSISNWVRPLSSVACITLALALPAFALGKSNISRGNLSPILPVPSTLQESGEQETSQDDDQQTAKEKARAARRAEIKRKREVAKRFMRLRRDSRGKEVALETSITRYQFQREDGKTVSVDLIGAVHIGEKEYFQALNDRFEQYDSMLYELVAPEGTVIPKGGGARGGVPTNPIAAMQKGMQAALGLEFQLEHIDYTKDNFVHADMTPEEFAESMTQNEESISKYAFKAIGQSMAMQSAGRGGDSMSMMMAMFSSNKEVKMRKIFAKQIQDMEAGMVIFRGKDGSTIIDHRNAKCMKVLEREIAKGKTEIAIFYGAGHLPDMERRLMSDFHMKRGGQTWLQAWRLK